MSATAPTVTDYCGGWTLLLPLPRAGERVLCIEPQQHYARQLSYWRDGVDVLSIDGAAALHVAGSGYDLVVLRLHTVGGSHCAQWLRECSRVLAPGGCLYLEFFNPHEFRALLARPLQAMLAWFRAGSVSWWRKQLHAVGFGTLVEYQYLVESHGLSMLLPAPGYRMAPTGNRLKEWLKRLLLGPTSKRWFAPAVGMLATRGAAPRTLLDELAAPTHIARAAIAPELRQLLINPGKVFVQFVTAGVPDSTFYVVPGADEIVRRRRRELAVMAELRASGYGIGTQLPAFSSELVLAGRPAFAYEWLEGLALDTAVAGFDGMVAQAAEILLQFNRDSLRRVTVGVAEFEQLAGQYCEGLAKRYPTLAPAAARLRAQLERWLLGKDLPVVWLHGDYKLENLLFRPPKAPKVIDWELAQSMGLPLLDMLYLLAYRRVTLGRAEDMLELLEPLLQVAAWEPWEQELLSRAAALASWPAAHWPVVHALLLVQHAGLRFNYNLVPGVGQATAAMGALLAATTARLENSNASQPWN